MLKIQREVFMERYENREGVLLLNKGQKIFGILHLPLEPKTCPGVLICHGLAGHKTGKNRLYVSLAKYLASQGIAALRIDFRGSGDSEGEFADATVDGLIEDAVLGLNYLSNHPQIDSKRIGLMGRSFGGTIAVMTANRFNSIKSLVLWAAMHNGQQWQDKWKKAQSHGIPLKDIQEMMRINGQVGSLVFFEQFFNIDVQNELHRLKNVPLLNIHGEKDLTVLPHHADLYREARGKAEAPSRFLRLPEGDHDFNNPSDQIKAIEETAKWFKATL